VESSASSAGTGLVYTWHGLDELLNKILIMGMELGPEMSVFNYLKWLVAQEDFLMLVSMKASNPTLHILFYLKLKLKIMM
jgi:hypothetical protein